MHSDSRTKGHERAEGRGGGLRLESQENATAGMVMTEAEALERQNSIMGQWADTYGTICRESGERTTCRPSLDV